MRSVKIFTLVFTTVFLSISFLCDVPDYNQNVLMKALGFEILTSLLCLSLLGFSFKRNLVVKIMALDAAIVFLLLIYLIFYWAGGTYLHNLISPVYYFVFYITLRLLFQTLKERFHHNLLKAFSIIAPITIVMHLVLIGLQRYNIIPSFHSIFNNGSTFGNPDMLGTFIAILMPFCFAIRDKGKILGYIGFLSGLFLLIFIQARSSILAVTLTGIIWTFNYYNLSKTKIVIISTSFLVLLIGLIVWHTPSVTGRMFIWYVSLRMFIKEPLGCGIKAYDREYPLFQGDFFSNHPNFLSFINPSIDHSPFNEFIHTAVCLGIAGLLALLLICVFIYKSFFKYQSIWFYPTLIFLIISCSYFTFSITPVVVVSVICLAALANNSRCLTKFSISQWYKYLFFFTVSLSSLMIVSSIKNFIDYKKWTKAIAFMEGHKYKESEKLFEEIYPSMKGEGRFLLTYAVCKLSQKKPLIAIELFKETIRIFIEDAFILKLGNVYEEKGDNLNALKMYKLASDLAPNKFYPPYYKILLLEKMHRKTESYNEAVKLFNKEIKSNLFADPYIIKSEIKAIINRYQQKTDKTSGN